MVRAVAACRQQQWCEWWQHADSSSGIQWQHSVVQAVIYYILDINTLIHLLFCECCGTSTRAVAAATTTTTISSHMYKYHPYLLTPDRLLPSQIAEPPPVPVTIVHND